MADASESEPLPPGMEPDPPAPGTVEAEPAAAAAVNATAVQQGYDYSAYYAAQGYAAGYDYSAYYAHGWSEWDAYAGKKGHFLGTLFFPSFRMSSAGLLW